MASIAGFTPGGATSTIAATSTSAAVALNGTGNQVFVANVGTKEAAILFGTANTVTAIVLPATTGTTGSIPIPAGLAVALNVAPGMTHVAAITAGADTTTLRFVRGDGQ